MRIAYIVFAPQDFNLEVDYEPQNQDDLGPHGLSKTANTILLPKHGVTGRKYNCGRVSLHCENGPNSVYWEILQLPQQRPKMNFYVFCPFGL